MVKSHENSTINFMYFMFNFTPNFIEKVWQDDKNLISHLNSKWYEFHRQFDSPTLAFSKWFMELDRGNQTMLCEWINVNYKSF